MTLESIIEKLTSLKGKNTSISIKENTISYDISKALIKESAIDLFEETSTSLKLIPTFNSFLSENSHNITESQSVDHHQLRSENQSFFSNEKNRLIEFIDHFHKTNTAITDVVQIGIGGSYLGPRLIHEALSFVTDTRYLNAHFITNIDPLEFDFITQKINPKTTLFIIASKSGNTIEIESNITLLKEWWKSHNLSPQDLKKQTILLTTKDSPLDNSKLSDHQFYIKKSIGGRFSATSVIGLCLAGLCFGSSVIDEILDGAQHMDKNAQNQTLLENIALLAAWEHIWQRNVKNYSNRVIISYSSALQAFPLYCQQLTCESNGKSVDINGNFLSYKTAPIIITGVGTNSQHSFFQLLHQGTDIIPVEFIGIRNLSKTKKLPGQSKAQELLFNSIKAQQKALSDGEIASENHFSFQGNRPSSLLYLDSLSPYSIGQLIAFYENKTLFEGLIWNINSFDQIGVNLGKKILESS